MRGVNILTLVMLGVFLMVVLPSVSAQNAYKLGEDADIIVFPTVQGSPQSTIQCNLTILSPTSQFIVDYQTMTNNFDYHNYTVNHTILNNSGDYIQKTTCVDPVSGLNRTTENTIVVNPGGVNSSEERTSSINIGIIFFFLIGAILFFGFIVTKQMSVKWSFFIIAVTFWLVSINIISVSITDVIVNTKLEGFFDFFVAISFYFYWLAGGLLIALWMITFIGSFLYNKSQEEAARFTGREFGDSGF